MTASSSSPPLPPRENQVSVRAHMHVELVSSLASHGVSSDDPSQYVSCCSRRLSSQSSRLLHGKKARRDSLHRRMCRGSRLTKVDEGAREVGVGARTLIYLLRQRKEIILLLCMYFSRTTVVSLSSSRKQLPSVHRHRPSLAFVENCLRQASTSFVTAGELTSEMASKLPNWYSSKEGLTGESPAVFGGCGMSLIQAGMSLLTEDRAPGLSSIIDRFESCACDLASGACALEPIGIGEPLDRACEAMYDLTALLLQQRDNCDDGSSEEENRIFSPSSIDELCHALIDCESSFHEYGKLLLAEDSVHGESAAGSILSLAGDHLGHVAEAFSQINKNSD